MTKLFLPYNKTILKGNIIFSVFLTILSALIVLAKQSVQSQILVGITEAQPPKHSIVWLFIFIYTVWIMTGGFLLSAYYFEITRRNEYYFYYNLGLSKISLLLYTYTLHIIFIVPFLILLNYV